ncbi:MAG: hypothetical protein A2X23_00220 [Chloroflexi bacterium GWC2_73_18]|nr:MAG: hypothetical protein A2X23_00220 [Chloroflexi bacterium GWC2_73_18]
MVEEAARDAHDLLVRVASAYYLDDLTQAAVARELGLSRQRVQRLLGRARRDGVVEIRIHASPRLNLGLEARLKETFRLAEANVTVADPDPGVQREAVARAAAGYLERRLHDGAVVAVGMGRNTGEIPRFFRPRQPVDCTFVSAIGGSPRVDAPTNPNEICRALAERCGGRAEALYAPAYVESPEVRDRLLAQEAVAHTLQVAARAEIALVGIGGTDDDATLLRSGCLSVVEVRRLRRKGAVGDVLGNYMDVEGQVIASDVDGRLIRLTLDDLRRIGTVVGVVSEPHKSLGILAALRSGVLDVLVVDAENAAAVLEGAGAGGAGDERATTRRSARP